MNIQNFYYPDGLPDPITRREVYLSAAAGEDASLPDPITREEVYLKAIAEGGGGGGGIPAPSSPNTGDVLQYNGTSWVGRTLDLALEDAQAELVQITEDQNNPGTYIIDKTVQELLSLFMSCRKAYFFGMVWDDVYEYFEPQYFDMNTGEFRLKGPINEAKTGILTFYPTQNNNMEGTYTRCLDMTPFVVTLTPTALDYSGTMSATVGEIAQEFQKGRKIVFRLLLSASESYDAECTARYNTSNTYPSFNAFIITAGLPVGNAICFLATGTTNNPDDDTYNINIFPIVTTAWQGGNY